MDVRVRNSPPLDSYSLKVRADEWMAMLMVMGGDSVSGAAVKVDLR